MKILVVIFSLCTSMMAYADQLNPCEYMNMNVEAAKKLDVGNDPNFTRIVQQNNRDMIVACQEYEIKQLRERKSDWDRDNY